MHFYVALEKSCQVQLLADAAAAGSGVKPCKVGHDEALISRGLVGSMQAGYFNGLTYYQLLEAQEGVAYDFTGKIRSE